MDKLEVKAALKDTRSEFMKMIEGLPEQAMLKPGVNGEWSIKDLMVHISLWEAELVRLLFEAQQGQKPTTVHFLGKATDQINQQWYAENRDRPLDRALEDFQAVRRQTIKRVDTLSDEDLTDPQRYPWLEGYPLWKWIAGDTFEHESEHIVQIRKWRAEKI